jgi:hypothetical protein
MKFLPYIKWILGMSGLLIAIHTSQLIMDVYIEKDLLSYSVIENLVPSRDVQEALRKDSIMSAYIHIFIFMFGVMASFAWLAIPKTNGTSTESLKIT